MSLVLRAAVVSLAAHALFLALLGWLPGDSPTEEGPALPRGDFTLVWAKDEPSGGAESAEPFVPILVAATPEVRPEPPPPGPMVSPAPPGSEGQGGQPAGPTAPGGGASRSAPRARLNPARSVVFLLDRSLSMGLNGTLTPAKAELRALLESLPPTTHFQVVAYGRTAESLVPGVGQRLVRADATALQQAIGQIERLAPEGGTEHVQALRRGLLLRSESLVLLTDGLTLPDGAVEDLTALNQGRTAIHVVELTRFRQAEASPTAVRLTGRNRGTAQAVQVR